MLRSLTCNEGMIECALQHNNLKVTDASPNNNNNGNNLQFQKTIKLKHKLMRELIKS